MKLIWEKGQSGRRGYIPSPTDTPEVSLEQLLGLEYRKEPLDLPEVSELDVIRHYTNLAHQNYAVDSNFYPLGSCTMKYSPKVNEDIARVEQFQNTHPLCEEGILGSIEIMYKTQELLAKISGMAAVSLQPLAGAHGELTGLMLIKAYQKDHNQLRDEIIVPDSAHGTNPASAAMCGFKVVEVKSKGGLLDPEALKKVVSNKTAAIMLTNPNTLGLFEKDILEIGQIVHASGGLLYYDGANLNALLGKVRPGDMGFDVMHFNLHKTFSTPHGGGGPGSGPVGVSEKIAPYLPLPIAVKTATGFALENDKTKRPKSIGKVATFYGSFGVILKAFSYMINLGKEGLTNASEMAVLNANYLKALLSEVMEVPYSEGTLHEFVATASGLDLSALEIAKALLDYGYHAPTIYFPLIVSEALMIEPTETESPQTLDEFAEVIKEILEKVNYHKEAPHFMPVKRIDEVKAARHPILTRAQLQMSK